LISTALDLKYIGYNCGHNATQSVMSQSSEVSDSLFSNARRNLAFSTRRRSFSHCSTSHFIATTNTHTHRMS